LPLKVREITLSGRFSNIFVRTMGRSLQRAIRQWLRDLGVEAVYIEPGNPWESGYIEPFNGKLRDELLNMGIFTTLF